MVRFKVFDIAWEVDDKKDLNYLPSVVFVDVDEEDVACDLEEEIISDYLSNKYGYLHNGFLYNYA